MPLNLKSNISNGTSIVIKNYKVDVEISFRIWIEIKKNRSLCVTAAVNMVVKKL